MECHLVTSLLRKVVLSGPHQALHAHIFTNAFESSFASQYYVVVLALQHYFGASAQDKPISPSSPE